MPATAATADIEAAERSFADFLDAHGASETLATGVLAHIEGRDGAAWRRVREDRARELAAHLQSLQTAALSAQEARVLQSMRTTFEELAGPASVPVTPAARCRDATRKDATLGELKASLYACFDEIGNRLRFEGGNVTRSGALQLLQELEEPARRQALFMAMAPLWQAVNGDGSRTSPYRRLLPMVTADIERSGSPVDTAAAALGVTPAQLERWLVQVLEAWREAGAPREALIEPWDFRHHYAQASRGLNAAIPYLALERLNARFFADLGADPRTLGTLFDLQPRPGKAPIAYADALRIGRRLDGAWRPAVPRISASYDRGGLYTLNELVHETGHAVHIAASRARPAFFWADTLLMEAFADVPSWAVFDPSWQEKYLGRAATRQDALREQFALVMLDVAWGLFEIRMLREPAADPNLVWTEITRRYLRIAPRPELSWWAVRAQLVDAPGYMINYAAGAALTADLRGRTRDAIGAFDAGNPRWYAWLSQQLLQYGSEMEMPVLLRRFLGRDVSPDALIAEIASIAAPDRDTPGSPPDSGSIAIRCGRLIDGVSDEAMPRASVVIRRGRIAAVGTAIEPPADLPLLDLPDHTCLPGLIDMHTHLNDRPQDTADMRIYFRRTPEEAFALARANAQATLLAGFTTVRNVGTYLAWSDRELRDAIDRGQVAGPRMQASGFYLTIPRGGGDLYVPGASGEEDSPRFHAGVARGAEAFRRKTRSAIDGGADVIKVIASGAVLAHGGVPGEREMTPRELAAVIREAHAAGRRVAAHAHGAQSIKDAILAGADTIEHASLIDDEGIALARARGVALSMDVYNGDYIDTEGRRQGWPAEFLRKNLETTEAQRQAFTRAHAAGVPIVYGTDAAVYPHGLNARQFAVMVSRGMTSMEAIRSATSVAARYMGWDDRVGRLAPARFGDLIAVRGDPLQSIEHLQRVEVVVKGGHLVKGPAPSARP